MNGNPDTEWPLWVPVPLRDIVEEATFSEQARLLTGNVERFDEIMSGITWALARSPESFDIADHQSGIRIAKTDAWGSVPSLRVFFKFDDKETRLLWVEPIPPEEDSHLGDME